MDSNPLISVVIPTYNRAEWLEECLDSVLAQRLHPLEVIVIDDGSTDDTERLCRRLNGQVKYLQQANRGVSAARNQGLAVARGEWIALLDSDDLWHPDKLQQQWDFVCRRPDIRVVQTDEIWIRNGTRVNPKNIHRKPRGWIFEDLIPLCLVSPSAVMVHRNVFDHIGHFDEALPACEDYDLWLRMAPYYQIETLPETLTIKRGGHEDQLSAQWGLDRYRIKALEKAFQNRHLTAKQRELVREDIMRRCSILIQGFAKRDRHEDVHYYESLLQDYER